MITNPTLQILSSFEKIKLPKMGDKPTSINNESTTRYLGKRYTNAYKRSKKNAKERRRRWNSRLIDLYPEWV